MKRLAIILIGLVFMASGGSAIAATAHTVIVETPPVTQIHKGWGGFGGSGLTGGIGKGPLITKGITSNRIQVVPRTITLPVCLHDVCVRKA